MKWYLRRIYLNSGGYDRSGCYYGLGQPLYSAESEDYTEHREFRVARGYRDGKVITRENAKAFVRKHYDEDAKFFN